MNKILIDRSVLEQALASMDQMLHSGEWYCAQERAYALRAALEQDHCEQHLNMEQPQVEQEPVAWIERWYGSGPERGWWIVCGRDHIAHLGPAEMSGEAASKIVSAHNTSPPAQRQPLTDAQINDHRLALAYDSEDLPDPWDFKQGVRAAERAHGIGGEK